MLDKYWDTYSTSRIIELRSNMKKKSCAIEKDIMDLEKQNRQLKSNIKNLDKVLLERK